MFWIEFLWLNGIYWKIQSRWALVNISLLGYLIFNISNNYLVLIFWLSRVLIAQLILFVVSWIISAFTESFSYVYLVDLPQSFMLLLPIVWFLSLISIITLINFMFTPQFRTFCIWWSETRDGIWNIISPI